MKNSSLIEIINSLDNQEIKKLRSFLISPYFNHNKNVTRLFDFIISHKKESRITLNKKELHDNVFSSREYNNENIKTIIYLTTRLCERFLVINSIENNSPEYTRKLLGIFDIKGLDKLFLNHLNKTSGRKSQAPIFSLNSAAEENEYEKTLIEFYSKRNFEKEMFIHEQKLSESLIAAFLIDMFKQYNIFWRTGYLDNIKGNEFTTALLGSLDTKKLFKFFNDNKFRYNSLLMPYYEIYCLLNETRERVNFHSIKEHILMNTAISGDEKFVLSTILVNTLYYKNLKSGGYFSRDLFEAYKLLVQLYEYSGEQYLRFTIFSNVLRMGLQLGEFEWTEEFIHKYHIFLEPSTKNNMLNYSNAYLSFSKGDFEMCLEYESKINFETFQQRYYLRDLRLCSLYELGKYETALNLIDSYKHFIKKDQNYTAKMKQGYLLFLRHINDLIRLKLGISRKNVSDIKEKLLISLPMRKDWLINKFEEIEHKLTK